VSRREYIGSGVFSGLLAAAWLWLGPPGSDLAAHEYLRWFFVQHGFALWDDYWYSGRYVFATYSWLTYPLAAVLGVKLLFALAVGVAAAAFARLVDYRPAAWAFAVVWGCFALAAALPFAVGVAFALVALNTRRWFPVFAALTWAASPLALLLLLVVVLGLRRWPAAVATLPFVVLQLVLQIVYPNAGKFPFPWQEAAAAAIFCVAAIALARGRIRGVFVAWLALVVLSFAYPSLLGENAARLRFMALPLALLVLRGRPLRLVIPLAAIAAVYNLSPLYWSFRKGLDERAEAAAYWAPSIAFLRAHWSPDFRVNALDTVGHWEAYHLPRAGIPITRGWYRQDDFPQNELLYHPMRRGDYVRWLHAQAVRYVLVPDDRLDYSSKYEPAVARSLRFVARAGSVRIYAVPRPRPLAPGATVLTHDSITLRVKCGLQPRTTRLAIRNDHGGWRRLRVPRAGAVTADFP
jgi:hypothetical protein